MDDLVTDRKEFYTISIVEDLLRKAKSSSATYRHFETLAYIKQCKFLAPYNAFLVMQQRQSPSVVLSAEQWLEHGRKPKPGVQPIVILKPYGPVSFVYDLEDTEGYPLTGIPPNLPTAELIRCLFPTDGWAPGMEERYARIVRAIEKGGAYFREVAARPELSGRARFDRSLVGNHRKEQPLSGYSIEINRAHPIEVKLCGFIHELAHIYCNHFTCTRPHDEEEVEAEAVAYAFCYRRGFRPRSEEYLARFLIEDRPMPIGFWDRVLTALKQIERLEEAVEEKEGLPPLDFNVSIGGYMGDSYSVALEGGKLIYEVLGHGYKTQSRKEIDVSPKKWAVFWSACNKHGVWGWKKEYRNPGICDGTQWSIVIRTDCRFFESHGDNAYPGEDRELASSDDWPAPFQGFLRAVSRLVGGLAFE